MSDHKDAHLAEKYPECDIGDLWAFHTGLGAEARVVFVMTVNAGEVGLVHYGPRGHRNTGLYTTVPKRLLPYVPRPGAVEAAGLLAAGDLRGRLTGHLRFHPDAVYEFRIAKRDGEGVLRPAISFKVVFDGEGGIPSGRRTPQRQPMSLLKAEADRGDHVERGDNSGRRISFDRQPETHIATDPQRPDDVVGFVASTPAGPVRLFAGPRQDPFTFDFEGVKTRLAHQYRKELCGTGAPSGGSSDAFSRAFNISAIVLEVPIQEILSEEEIGRRETFAVWSATTLQGHPINRAGWPLFKPSFLPKSDFEEIIDPTNATRLEQQRAVFTPLLEESLQRLDVPAEVRRRLIDLVLPDALALDVWRPPGLGQAPPNGRTLGSAGDPARFFISLVDPAAYEKRRRKAVTDRPPPLEPLPGFPYLTAPSATTAPRGSAGWSDFVPIPDPPWPTGWDEPTSCDDYLDGLIDPTVREVPARP
jgi:Domain of unknown function (DUF4331)